MARVEARLSVDIWRDTDFLALTANAQRLYMFLLSQPELAYDGVCPLRERRWAKAAAGLNLDQVQLGLDELAGARFILVDEDTEELLVRSLIRRDGVYKQPQLLRAARKHLAVVTSAKIRAALVVELERVLTLDDAEKGREVVLAMLKDLRVNPLPIPTGKPATDPTDNPTPDPASDPSRRASGERGGYGSSEGDPLSPGPSTLPPMAGTAAPPSTAVAVIEPPPDTAGTLIGEWLDHVPKRPPGSVIARVGKHLRAMLGEGIDPADVRRGLIAWVQRGLDPATLPSVVNELMNAPIRAAPPRPSTTDSRVAAGLAIAEQLEARERAQQPRGAISS